MKTIGLTTKYLGEEFAGLHGREVRILAVLRGGLLPGVDVDAAGYFLTTDEEVARFDGVGELDRVAVALLREDGSPSSVHWSARAVDLECFAASLR